MTKQQCNLVRDRAKQKKLKRLRAQYDGRIPITEEEFESAKPYRLPVIPSTKSSRN